MRNSQLLKLLLFSKKCVDELYDFRDHYFEKNGFERASEKTKDVGEKMLAVKENLDRLLGI